MKSRNYRDLIAWQRAMDLVEEVYRLVEQFPQSELYGLSSQIRRAAVSVPSNIAEGQGRDTKKEFNHFLSIAMGSLREVETQLMIAVRLQFLSNSDIEKAMNLAEECGKTINGLKKHLRQSQDEELPSKN